MTALTTDGHFLSGAPAAIIARLESLVVVGATLQGSRDAALILSECRRIKRYRTSIGPALADIAAYNLLKGLAEDGHLLIKP
jgi:hypothetical protein